MTAGADFLTIVNALGLLLIEQPRASRVSFVDSLAWPGRASIAGASAFHLCSFPCRAVFDRHDLATS